jgi:hypothetical protein
VSVPSTAAGDAGTARPYRDRRTGVGGPESDDERFAPRGPDDPSHARLGGFVVESLGSFK